MLNYIQNEITLEHFLHQKKVWRFKKFCTSLGLEPGISCMAGKRAANWAITASLRLTAKIMFMKHLFDEAQNTLLKINPWDLPFKLIFIIFLGQILHQESMKVKKFCASPGIEPGISCMADKRAANWATTASFIMTAKIMFMKCLFDGAQNTLFKKTIHLW